jgi:prepilin-type N-terminal cleavage/methylation domain-containing protein
MKKMNKKGFTIVELVIVIAVIAILSAVLIPTFSGVVEDANKTAAVADAKASYQQYVADATLATKTAAKDALYVDVAKGYTVVIENGQVGDAYKTTDLPAKYTKGNALTLETKTETKNYADAKGNGLYALTVKPDATTAS